MQSVLEFAVEINCADMFQDKLKSDEMGPKGALLKA
jgi:hypothetical protein